MRPEAACQRTARRRTTRRENPWLVGTRWDAKQSQQSEAGGERCREARGIGPKPLRIRTSRRARHRQPLVLLRLESVARPASRRARSRRPAARSPLWIEVNAARSPGRSRSRISGFFRSVPVPEQGASRRTASKRPGGGGRVASARTTSTSPRRRRPRGWRRGAPPATPPSSAPRPAGRCPRQQGPGLPSGAAARSTTTSAGGSTSTMACAATSTTAI